MVSLWTLCDLIMNDKLKELSDIAYQKHLKNYTFSSFGRRADYDKEFAELIIRECASLFEIEYGTSVVTGNRAAEVIKNHFGIE